MDKQTVIKMKPINEIIMFILSALYQDYIIKTDKARTDPEQKLLSFEEWLKECQLVEDDKKIMTLDQAIKEQTQHNQNLGL